MVHSQNQAEDVVALPLLPDEREFEFTAIPTTMFLSDRTLNSGAAAEGDELYFIGLMEQYYGAKRNYPLVRRGTLALLTDEDIDTPTGRQKVLIAELESWPGNSGAPVFLLGGRRDSAPAAGNTVEFLGIIVASFLNTVAVPLGPEQPGRQLEGGDKANIGMTCIVPATMIAEVLDSVPAQQDRDARIRGVGRQKRTSSSGTAFGAVRSEKGEAMTGRNIKLHELRMEKHWTLRHAAQHMGVSRTVLFNAEQGVMPRVDHAIKMAGIYNRSVEELWTPAPSTQPLHKAQKCVRGVCTNLQKDGVVVV